MSNIAIILFERNTANGCESHGNERSEIRISGDKICGFETQSKHAENEGGNALMCCFESDVSMRCRRKLVSVFWAFDSMLRMRTHSRSHSLSQPFSDVLKAFLEMLKEVEAGILLPDRRKGII